MEDASLQHQETVCPQDVLIEKQKDFDYILISSDQLAEDSDAEETAPTPFQSTNDETDPGDDWRRIQDLLFQSVGLERVPECWELVKEKTKQEAPTGCRALTVSALISDDLQEQLTSLYFLQFHPVCPAVDEFEFFEWRRKPEDYATVEPQLMQLLLLSITFAASPYLDGSLLEQGRYDSVKHMQKALFTSAQTMYHSLEAKFLGAEALAQSALLLSYWSPCDSTKEVNSYWSDEAVRHAVAGGMSAPSSTRRRRIIWWCCLIRNRMISLGLRRFSRLEKRPDGRLPETTDFGQEISQPHFTTRESKIHFTRAFALICSLTRTMVESVWLQDRKYHQAWSLPTDQRAIHLMKRVGQLDAELDAWTFKFSRVYAALSDMTVPHSDHVIFHLIGLMHQFAISILYEPFLRLRDSDSDSAQAWFVKDHALLKIKEVSKNTATITASMLEFATPKDLPIILPPWIILPIALHFVQLSEPQVLEVNTQITQQLGYLMRALHCLTCRYEGVKYIIRILDAIILFVRKSQEEVALNQPLAQVVYSRESGFQARRPQLRQGKVIIHVLDFIRNGLAAESVQF